MSGARADKGKFEIQTLTVRAQLPGSREAVISAVMAQWSPM